MLTVLKKNEKGLTLIELLAVLVIIGIIAAIAIPAITGTINNAKARADDATENMIIEAATRYALDKSTHDTNFQPSSANVVRQVAIVGDTDDGGLYHEGYLNDQYSSWQERSGTFPTNVYIRVNTNGTFDVSLSVLTP